MTKNEAIRVAKKLNKKGDVFLLGGKITHIAQNSEGEWKGFPDMPEVSRFSDDWECQQSICLDREWNDNWEETLTEITDA